VGACVQAPNTPSTPVCTTGQVMCTTAMQAQGMNCVVGACVQAPSTPNTPVCTTGQIVCSTAMQAQGMNCILGQCTQAPGSITAMVGGARDPNGCVKGAGYSWCAAKSKCLRSWEEPCEETSTPSTPVCANGQVACTAAMQSQGMNCIVGACVTAMRPAVGGARDANGCVSGGGYQWCDSKKKCLREWEEACETTPQPDPEITPETTQTAPARQTPNFVRNIVSNLSPDQRAQVSKIMGDLKAKKAQYSGVVKQKLAELKSQGSFSKMGNALRDRMQQLASAIGVPAHTDKPDEVVAVGDE